MRRFGYGLAALLIALTLTQGTAVARDPEWCWEDPVFLVLGGQFRLTTGVAAPSVSSVAYVITLPSNAEGAASVHYPPGSRVATTVEFRYAGPAYSGSGTFTVSAAVTATSSTDAALTVDLTGPSVTDATFSGSTNKTVRAQFDVAGR